MNNCRLQNVITLILQPLLVLVSAVAVLVFVWGIVEYLWKLRKGESTADGKLHMLWGLVGLFIIVGTFAIMNLIANTTRSLLP